MRVRNLTRGTRVLSIFFVFVCAGVLSLSSFLSPGAWADVRKSDVVYGQSVATRGLSVSQCPTIDAEHAIVMGSDGTIYFERNANEPTQIASLTKIMTAVVALDAVDSGIVSLDMTISVSSEAAKVGGSSAGLQEGDTLDLRSALTAMLVPSGNDAAVAIAQGVGAALQTKGGVEGKTPEAAFVNQMNDTAKRLGCTNTLYENPHGLDFDEYAGDLHSTVADQAKVVQYAMKNQLFRADVAQGDATISVMRDGSPTSVTLITTDDFPSYSKAAIGVKTGFTSLAGDSFAAATSKDGLELYAILTNSSSETQRFQDAANLTDWVYSHIKSYPLAQSSQTTTMNGVSVPVIAKVADGAWTDKCVTATLANPQASVSVFDLNGNVSQSLSYEQLSGSVSVGEKVGTITFKQRNNVIATQDLVATEQVDGPGFFEGIGIWWDRLFRGITGQAQTAQSEVINQTPLIVDKALDTP